MKSAKLDKLIHQYEMRIKRQNNGLKLAKGVDANRISEILVHHNRTLDELNDLQKSL